MDYIVNPITNRKVSIYGKKGREILNMYINQFILNGGSSKEIDDCVKSKINCSNKSYPCYNNDNMTCCFQGDTNKCVKSNFHPDNLYGECIRDRINCTDKLYPCYNYNDETCCSRNKKKCKFSNFNFKRIDKKCVVDKINCNKKKYPCYNFKNNTCCTKNKKKCINANFNI